MSDIVVLPSYYGEGVPRILLEALAMGKPIVTTNNVGCKEVVDQGYNGYLVPARDSNALAEAIGDLLNFKEKRDQFGHNSRLKAENEYDEKIIIDKVLKHIYGLN
jgi:N,N'-diacetylbacillosaminyl-diphospho-undecaprenol alpha-1,3-N-acetylgalactosaminyltransferase